MDIELRCTYSRDVVEGWEQWRYYLKTGEEWDGPDFAFIDHALSGGNYVIGWGEAAANTEDAEVRALNLKSANHMVGRMFDMRQLAFS